MLYIFEDNEADPGSFLQQRVSSHVRSSLHLWATLENLTLRHFDLNLQRQVSLHSVLWDSNLADWLLWVSRATWCTRTRRCRRACRSMRDQVQRRLRMCINSLFSCSLFHSFRHCFGAACWTEHDDIELMEKIISFITCEIALCQYVCELVFGVNIFDFFLFRIYSVDNQSSTTLWVRDTCLIVGLLPLMIILITEFSTTCKEICRRKFRHQRRGRLGVAAQLPRISC